MAIKWKFPARTATVHCSGGCRAKRDENGGLLCAYGCVACGACVEACRFGAVQINDLGCAEVDEEKCIGCGRKTTGFWHSADRSSFAWAMGRTIWNPLTNVPTARTRDTSAPKCASVSGRLARKSRPAGRTDKQKDWENSQSFLLVC